MNKSKLKLKVSDLEVDLIHLDKHFGVVSEEEHKDNSNNSNNRIQEVLKIY